ncbi:MAG: hypothetical protein CH6_3499 [Candidatus Kapaibacterium sp.]|jgi:hypothetical protein|nr:MAG: hypothetical protein CH6_3499 [Candidatus Kapabacteria bacterium]ROL55634.1 MAG: hypothetical protein D9V84_11265 [Bacteroidetes/Chlorobi group bacterium Naka2016]
MKKYIFLLVATIILGFVAGNKASGQCEVCQTPFYNYCFILDPLPTSCGPGRAVFCYDISYCPNAISIQVVEVEAPPDCIDEAWDYLYNWVRNNIQELCGYKPCSEPPPMTIYYSVPICGEVTWYGVINRVAFRAHPGPCDLRCTIEMLWCYDYNTNKPVVTEVNRYLTGTGTCPYIPYGRDPLAPPEFKYIPGEFWRINCTRILEVIYCN